MAILLAAAAPNRAEGSADRGDFDLRLSAEKGDVQALAGRRARHGSGAAVSAAVEGGMRAARARLAAQQPALQLIDSVETGAPEVVGVARGRAFLTGPSNEPREQVARRFVEDHAALWGLSHAQAVALETDADYTNPAGNLSWVRLKQTLGGLPVFRGTITLAFTPRGEIARATGQLAAGLPARAGTARPSLSAAEAVAVAAATLGRTADPESLVVKSQADDGSWVVFESGPFGDDVKVELLFFPLGPGAVELAWSVLLWGDTDAHWTIVGADDGLLLWRKNLTAEVAFSYRVYASDSPSPMSPTTATPDNHQQGPGVSRSLIAVESENSLNDPWLAAGATITDGNNVEAGIDRVSPNGVDPGGQAGTTSANTFDYSYSPPPLGAGDPLGAAYQDGAVTNLFFWTNRFHDRTYDLGFTEPAFNYQTNNYGRGGAGNDRISAEAQDVSGTSNANFTTPPDGGRGRLQMFLWTGPTPDRDGALDAEVVLHELTHGLSSRLHGNASGLSTNMSLGLGEGWSDFYALSMLSQPGDDPEGIYSFASYASSLLISGFLDNYYYGIRRFPKSVMSNTGGPGDLPHNPLTFADVDSTQLDVSDGAYPPGPLVSPTVDNIHNLGEIWSTALWEVRAKVASRLGNTAGNERMLQIVTDGMKLDPLGPTFLQARDAILAADCAGFDGEDEVDIWDGFAIRGLGLSAEVLNTGSGANNTRVVEAFDGGTGTSRLDLGPADWENNSCSTPGRNPQPGEQVWIKVLLDNPFCGTDIGSVVVSIPGGASRSFGTIAAGGALLAYLPYTIPATSACGSMIQLDVRVDSTFGGQNLSVAVPVGPRPLATTSFTNATTINLPAGQPGTTSGPAAPYPSQVTVAGIVDPVFDVTVRLNGLSHSFPDDVDLLLVAPNGDKIVLMSDVGGSVGITGVTLTLVDDAATPMPDGGTLATGSYRPSDVGAGDAFVAPAPPGPHGEPAPAGSATLGSVVGGDNVNGVWSLYVVDDETIDVGSISGGWTLGIRTLTTPVCTPCTVIAALFSDGFESGDTLLWTGTVPTP